MYTLQVCRIGSHIHHRDGLLGPQSMTEVSAKVSSRLLYFATDFDACALPGLEGTGSQESF